MQITIASETDARKMQSFARLGGLKEAPASIGGEYFTCSIVFIRTCGEVFSEVFLFFREGEYFFL